MKKYPVKYTAITYILLAIVMLLTAVGVGWNIYNVFHTAETLKIVTFILTAVLSFIVFALAVSVTFFSRYVLKKDKLIAFFGFIPSTYKLNEAIKITHFKLTDKLVIYFSDATYTTILIAPKFYDSFTEDARKFNSYIICEEHSETNTEK